MTTKTDPELERWQSLWQSDDQLPRDLQKSAMRQVRRMQMMLAADIAVTVVIGGVMLLWAVGSSQLSVRLLAAWVWLTIAAAWIFRYFNHRGNGTGVAPSTDEFFEAWVRRCREIHRNLRFGLGLGVVQLVVVTGWDYHELRPAHGLTLLQFATMIPMLLVWLFAAGLFAWVLRLTGKVRAEWFDAQRLRDEWANGEPLSLTPETPPGVRKPPFLNGLIESIVLFPTRCGSQEWQLRRRRKRAWRL